MRAWATLALALGLATPAMAETYPVPKEPNQVFYVQRSLNPNTVIYAARLDKAGRLDPRQPVEVYWRRYNDEGERKELSGIERRLAFGVKAQAVKGMKNVFRVAVVSYPERVVTLKLVDGVPRLEGKVAGVPARLDHAYLEVDDSGTVPDVTRVRLHGFALATGEPVTESFIPE